MKKFLKSYGWIIAIITVLIVLGMTASYWATFILSWIGANNEIIQGSTSFVQLILWIGAAAIFVVSQFQKRKNPPTIAQPEKVTKEKLDVPISLVYPINIDEARDNIEKLLKWHEYEWAIRESETYIRELIAPLDRTNPRILLSESELKAHYARALIYVDRVKDAKECLDKIIEEVKSNYDKFRSIDGAESRAREVLGVVYNHKGYISWVKFGHYEDALSKFNTATTFLSESKDQLATALDNMGRVYGAIGYQERAELLILQGLAIRIQTGDDYRKALSLNSLAIVTLAFGNHQKAYQLADKAYQLFSKVHAKEIEDIQTNKQSGARGMGLATVTKAQALRIQGSYWREYKDSEQDEKSTQLLQSGIKELEFALAIFRENTSDVSEHAQSRLREEKISRPVKEPIRRYQVLNELGCIYRELGFMYKSKNLGSKSYEIKAQKYLEMSKTSSETELGHYVDSAEDLARLLFYMSDTNFARVLELTKDIQQKIRDLAENHLIHKGDILAKIPPEECLEDIWRQLAKIHMLIGQIQLKQLSNQQNRRDIVLQAIENYFVASLYLQRFLQRPLDSENAFLYPYASSENSYRRMLVKQFVGDLYTIPSLSFKDIEDIEKALINLPDEYKIPAFGIDANICLGDIKNSLGMLSIMRGYS